MDGHHNQNRVMNAPLLIEFAGLPGSGKSSLSDMAAAKLRSNGHEVRTVIDAARVRSAESALGRFLSTLACRRLARLGLWWTFYWASSLRAVAVAWENRREMMRLAAYQARRPIKLSLKAHIGWWYLQLGGRRSYLETSRSIDGILFDDGYVHRSVALFSSPKERVREQAIRDYNASIPAPSMIIQVSAPVSTCVERVIKRGVWRHSSDLTEPELKEYVRNAQYVLEIAISEARKRGVPVLTVSNDDVPLDHAANQVSEGLEGLLDEMATGRTAS